MKPLFKELALFVLLPLTCWCMRRTNTLMRFTLRLSAEGSKR
ncbi:hypothetical protein [Acetobacter sp. DsW_059]|nr:hypothetical protein [Acetobacter sp. DsW_059]